MVRRWTPSVTSVRAATATRTDDRRGRLTAAPAETLARLRAGDLEIIGRLADASNATFLCELRDADHDVGDDLEVGQDRGPATRAVYKPTRGERPLDDFPVGTLSRREVAAYLLSEATGWNIVPPTVWRDGPLGPGMVQLWIETDPEVDVLQAIVGRDERLRRICVFDVLANNADRKGGHLLPTPTGHMYGVDHGICFSTVPKLRTVLWGWRGEQLRQEELAVVQVVCDGLDNALGAELAEYLDRREVAATAHRAEALLTTRRFPRPDPSRPALPWPPF